MNSPAPWYVSNSLGHIGVFDVQGRLVATVCPQADPNMTESNLALVRTAPSLLVSLRIAIDSLQQHEEHDELVRHLQRYVDAACPAPQFSDTVSARGAA